MLIVSCSLEGQNAAQYTNDPFTHVSLRCVCNFQSIQALVLFQLHQYLHDIRQMLNSIKNKYLLQFQLHDSFQESVNMTIQPFTWILLCTGLLNFCTFPAVYWSIWSLEFGVWRLDKEGKLKTIYVWEKKNAAIELWGYIALIILFVFAYWN